MIRKRKGKYVVLSHDGKRSFGTYDTEAQAKKRLAQVHYFKYLHEDKGQVNGMDITKVLSYLKEESGILFTQNTSVSIYKPPSS